MKSMNKFIKDPSRRSLLKMAGGCAALTNTSLLSTMINLSATNSVVAQTSGLSGYKALVCVFLFGGNDSFNMLIPKTPAEHAAYLTARGGAYTNGNGALGIPAAQLDPTTITDTPSGRTFGIHPSMPEIKTLWDQGKATFIANVGSLVEPTTRAQYNARTNLPLGLFSHSDLQQHWMTTVPQSRSQVTGWAGRMADLMTDTVNTNPSISMNISLDSVNLLQTGGKVVPYVVTSSGAQEVGWYGPTWTQAKIFTTLTDDVLSRSYGNLLEKTFAQTNRTALDAAIAFNDAVGMVTSVDSSFPANPSNFQRQMRMIAKSIGAHQTIGQTRQIFFVGVGGWDNHDELINTQAGNLSMVSKGLKSFQDAIDSLGLTNDVLTFTASDFARTVSTNGKGSDHAWGGHQIIMGGTKLGGGGGPIVGGKIHGEYPLTLASTNPLNLGSGRFLPTTSVDQLACELAMWYGVPNDSSMVHILPNIRSFVQPGNDYPIGILA